MEPLASPSGLSIHDGSLRDINNETMEHHLNIKENCSPNTTNDSNCSLRANFQLLDFSAIVPGTSDKSLCESSNGFSNASFESSMSASTPKNLKKIPNSFHETHTPDACTQPPRAIPKYKLFDDVNNEVKPVDTSHITIDGCDRYDETHKTCHGLCEMPDFSRCEDDIKPPKPRKNVKKNMMQTMDQNSPIQSRKRKPRNNSNSVVETKVFKSNLDYASESQIEPNSDIAHWITKFKTWSESDKLQAINTLVGHCSTDQATYMVEVVKPLFQRDFISLLPRELALAILSLLEPEDLLHATQTCTYWRSLADDDVLWKEQCRRLGITRLCKRTLPIYPSESCWKSVYMRHRIIQWNWRNKRLRRCLTLRAHTNHVITCLEICDNYILSGSDDTYLKVWNSLTGRCFRILIGHSGGVWSAQMVGNIIVSGSTDKSIIVWRVSNGTAIHALHGHASTVRCLHLVGDKLVSGSRDATVRYWSVFQGKCLQVLRGHMAPVRCVQFDGRRIISGAYDCLVKVWNPETGECIHTLTGHTDRVYSLQFDGVHIVSGSLDASIRVWDVETGVNKHILMGHKSLTPGMQLRSNLLLSGNADQTVKIWDITSGECLRTFAGPDKHKSAITCIQANSNFVVTSSDDGTVKLWNYKTGKFIRDLLVLNSSGSGAVVWGIRASTTRLVCAVGSCNGSEETKMIIIDFDTQDIKCCNHCIQQMPE